MRIVSIACPVVYWKKKRENDKSIRLYEKRWQWARVSVAISFGCGIMRLLFFKRNSFFGV